MKIVTSPIMTRVVNLDFSSDYDLPDVCDGLSICIAVLGRPIMSCPLLFHSVNIYSCHGQQQSIMEPPQSLKL